MKKPAKRAKAKSSAKGTKRKSRRSAKAVQATSKTKSKTSTKRRTPSKERPATQAKPYAGVSIPKTRSKLKDVAKKAATAAIVAAGVAVVDTAVGELRSGKKSATEPGSNLGTTGQGGSDDTEKRR